MKKILFLVIAMALLVSMISCGKTEEASGYDASKNYTYLVAGLDNAASNSDVLFLMSYSTDNNEVLVIQIPRDTYCKYNGDAGKINRIIPLELSRGKNLNEAMFCLSEFISNSFGIEIDGYFSFDEDAFRKIVDAVGGVDISLDKETEIYDYKGERRFVLGPDVTHLNGEMAEIFVRFRKGYITGDLGRIDAQKIFLNSFFESVKKNVGIDEALKLVLTLITEIKTNVNAFDVVKIVAENKDKITKAQVTYVTLPGEAILAEDNLWYYVINRKNAAELMNRIYSGEEKSFDKNKNFTSELYSGFDNIYFDENADTRYKSYK